MIEKINIQKIHYFRGACDGLPQKTARVTLHMFGDLRTWRSRVVEADNICSKFEQILPVQALNPDQIAQLLRLIQEPGRFEDALANAISGLCVAIQREARDAVWVGRGEYAASHDTSHELRLSLPYDRELVLKDALQWAARWWMLWGASTENLDAENELLGQYRRWLDAVQTGGLPPNTLRFALSAYERGWPVSVQHKVLHIGWGAARKSLDSSFTGQTSQLAARIARDKNLTNRLLQQGGLPVPPSARVSDWDGALKIAQRLDWPVVIKPASLDQGVGVVPGIRDVETLRKAFDQAEKYSPGAVIVEKHIAGDDHRLLVVSGRMLMAVRRLQGGVTGDGRHTVAEMLAQANTDPRRGSSNRSLMMRLEIDDEALACLKNQAMDAESIPSIGQFVHLRRTANISTGGTAQDVTHLIHPDNRLLAERAARIVGLDIAGVDFLCPDISRSWREVGGGICEVNAQPGFRPHWLGDPGRDINGEILDILFAECSPRIPTSAIIGTKGDITVAHILHNIWLQAGFCNGMLSTHGVRLGETWVHGKSVPSANAAVQMLLPDSALQSLVLEVGCQELLSDGHPLDRYDVVALLNLQDENIGEDLAEKPYEMARLKAQLLERTSLAVVVNADDVRCLQLVQLTAPSRKLLVSVLANNAALLAHCRGGGRAVYPQVQDNLDWICLADGQSTQLLMPMCDIALTDHGRCPMMLQNVLFAIALAWAQGVDFEHIRIAMRMFIGRSVA